MQLHELKEILDAALPSELKATETTLSGPLKINENNKVQDTKTYTYTIKVT